MAINYDAEISFFDGVASQTVVKPMSDAVLRRYARPRRPKLFAKEKMFSLLPDLRPLRVLEIGCGEGVASTQLAFCGADVTGLDISPASIAVARRRAELQGLDIQFEISNVVDVDSLGVDTYDVVWCDLILHHLVEPLDSVLRKIQQSLKVGGRFIAREPVMYTGWLKAIRRRMPVSVEATPDEKPFGPEEFAVVEKYFPHLRRRYYRILARVDKITSRLGVIACAAHVDNLLLHIPGSESLAGNVVMWGDKS